MKYKIIVDSSSELNKTDMEGKGIDFSVIPFYIHVGENEYTDNEKINIPEMLDDMNSFSGKATSACASPYVFGKELSGADKYFIITISSKLSGSYNSALIAKENHSSPEDVKVIDSRATSGTMILIVEKILLLIQEGKEYKTICKEIDDYVANQIGLLFVLDKFDNLVKNGRMSALKAMIASKLSIKLICEAYQGEIKVKEKLFGEKRVFNNLIKCFQNIPLGPMKKKCIISHCYNEETALKIKEGIESLHVFSEVRLLPMRGLCSFYALEKGIIIGYEK